MTLFSLQSPYERKLKKTRQKSNVGRVADAKADDASSADMLPKVHKIDWESQRGILIALSKYNKNEQYGDLTFSEQIILLANNFTPTDLRPLLSHTAQSAGHDYGSIDWDSYKSTRRIGPKLASLIVKIVNAKADLSVPGKIIVK